RDGAALGLSQQGPVPRNDGRRPAGGRLLPPALARRGAGGPLPDPASSGRGSGPGGAGAHGRTRARRRGGRRRSEEHTSELQSRENLVCRLLLEKKKQHSVSRF